MSKCSPLGGVPFEDRRTPKSRWAEYICWGSMRARCYSPRANGYSNYGGRGIAVCDRWRESFENFAADMGPRPTPQHSIDRIDNDRGYEPGNCRWATRSEQMRNRDAGHRRRPKLPPPSVNEKEPNVTRGMLVLARAIVNAGISLWAASKRAEMSVQCLGAMLRGRPPMVDTIRKAFVFVPDATLWIEAASEGEREEWRQLIHAIAARSKRRAS